MPEPADPEAVGGAAIRFGAATGAEVGSIVALVESAYRGEESRKGWTTEADLVDGRRTDAELVAALLADTSSTVVLARRRDELVGCCALSRRPMQRVRLSMLAVAPDRQRAGVGRALVEEAARRAGEDFGARAVELAVLAPRQDLLAWYRRRGFRHTGRSEPFPYGDDRFGLPRRDDLDFVVLEQPLGAPPSG